MEQKKNDNMEKYNSFFQVSSPLNVIIYKYYLPKCGKDVSIGLCLNFFLHVEFNEISLKIEKNALY